jgi:hypothetical protein
MNILNAILLPEGAENWKVRHRKEVLDPESRCAPVVNMLRGIVQFTKNNGGLDPHIEPYVIEMLISVRAMLNYDMGRADCATLDRAVLAVAKHLAVDIS